MKIKSNMTSRTKFKIMYAEDCSQHPEKRGKPYLPPAEHFVVMSGSGVFFLYCSEQYYPSIMKLSDVLYKYDVVWK